jgi:PAS domain S-box-containing protein
MTPEVSVDIHDVTAHRKDGSCLEMAVSISQVMLAEKRHFVAILRDLTDRRKIEATLRESSLRFRELFEQSEDAIIFAKPGGSAIIDANATAERLFEYSRGELVHEGVAAICRPADIAWLRNVLGSVSASKPLQLDFMAARCKSGKEIKISLYCKVIVIMGVEVLYCTIRDISDRIRMEAEARDMQAKLIQANKMTSLGLLVSGVAHEINNPNTFIMANTEILGRTWADAMTVLREYYREHGDFQLGGLPFTALDETAPQLFSGIIAGSKRIDSIVSDLKNFARDERGNNAGIVDINRVATNAVTMIHHQILKFTDNFRFDPGEDIPPVAGSFQQLEQVLINLLLNACHALPSRSSSIRIITGYDAAAGRVVVTISDEGRGMTREESRRIMEPFFTTKLDSGGTGLGLSISNSIIREHKGTLDFESTPGKGTDFVISLPAMLKP